MQLVYCLPRYFRVRQGRDENHPYVASAVYHRAMVEAEINRERTQQAPDAAKLRSLGIPVRKV